MTSIAEYKAGLRALADFLDAHTATLPEPRYLEKVNTWSPDTFDEEASVIATARNAGLLVTVEDVLPDLRRVEVKFGAVTAQALLNPELIEGAS